MCARLLVTAAAYWLAGLLVPLAPAAAAAAAPTVGAGAVHACMARSGKAFCWGDNARGELGNNSTIASSAPVAVYTGGLLSGRTITQIATGTNFTCALDSTGLVYCWGLNSSGQLGNNSTAQSLVPVAVNTSGVLAGKAVTQLTAGSDFACALAGGAGYCWGANSSGQLGNNSTAQSLVPVAVNTSGVLAGVTLSQISGGSAHTCAVSSAGAGYCWGANSSGQLGNNSTTRSLVAVRVSTSGALSGRILSQVMAGASFTCGQDSTGQAYCWGLNSSGQLGNTSTGVSFLVPAVVAMRTTTIAVGSAHACTISGGQAFCWGDNTNGELGNNSTAASNVPVAVSTAGVLGGKVLVQIATGVNFSCALNTAGLIYCWGLNTAGQLGNNSTTQSLVPVAVSTSGVLAGRTLIQITAGGASACATDSLGSGYCWGANSNGQLGNASTTQSLVPVRVSSGEGLTLTQIEAGTSHACGVLVSSAADCWGLNANGQLGNNSTTQSTTPVRVSTSGVLSGKSVVQLTGGGNFSCALDSSGLAYCWGGNASGQLGNNSTSQSLVPVTVYTGGVLSGAVLAQISAGASFTCATDSTGTSYCWGANASGQLGNGTTTSSSVAVRVATPGGTLTLSVPASAALPATTAGGNTTGALGTVTVSDTRGLGSASWTVTVSSSPFTTGGGSPPETIAAANVSYWSGPAIATTGSGVFTPGQPTADGAVSLGTAKTAFSLTGGSGSNSASWNPALMISVPASAVAGPYTGTITHSVA